jgi:hypothetical protein
MNNILAALSEVGRIFAQKAEAKSQEVRTPKIEFKVGTATQNENVASIEVSASHPAVRAYEWGSGVHATKGEKKPYVIFPRNKNALAFHWDKVNESTRTGLKFMGISPTTGKAIFAYVEHPGVAARPFLAPTLEENQEEFKRILGQGFKAEILAGKNKVEVIEIK